MAYAIAFLALVIAVLVGIYAYQKIAKILEAQAALEKRLKKDYYNEAEAKEYLAFSTDIEDFVPRPEIEGMVQSKVAIHLNNLGLTAEKLAKQEGERVSQIVDGKIKAELGEFATKTDESFKKATKQMMADVDSKIAAVRVTHVAADTGSSKPERVSRTVDAMIEYLKGFNSSVVGSMVSALQREIDKQESEGASERNRLETLVSEARSPYHEAERILAAYEEGALPEFYSENGVLPYIEMLGLKTAKEKLELLGTLEDPEKYREARGKNQREIDAARRAFNAKKDAYDKAAKSLQRFDHLNTSGEVAKMRNRLAELKGLAQSMQEVERARHPKPPKAKARKAGAVSMPGRSNRPVASLEQTSVGPLPGLQDERLTEPPPVNLDPDVDDMEVLSDKAPSSVEYSLDALTSHFPGPNEDAANQAAAVEIPGPPGTPGGLFSEPIPAQRTCKNCKQDSPESTGNFCPNCGTKFD